MNFQGNPDYIVTIGTRYQRPSRHPPFPDEDDYGIQPAYSFYKRMRRNRRGYLPYHDRTMDRRPGSITPPAEPKTEPSTRGNFADCLALIVYHIFFQLAVIRTLLRTNPAIIRRSRKRRNPTVS